MILDEGGNVLTTNRAAEEILTRGTGLTISQRRLLAGSRAEQLDVGVRQALAQRFTAAPSVSDAMSISRPGCPPLSALVKPVPMTEPAEGLSLDEAGARLGISRNTVKSRLGAIFAKTGVKRQSSLVRVLLDAIATM